MKKLNGMKSSPALPRFRFINPIVVLSRIGSRYGIEPETLLEGSGIEPRDLYDPLKRISLAQEKKVAMRLIERAPVPWLGLEVGKEYHFSANGKLGMAAMCCETLLEALLLIMAYSPLTASYHQYVIEVKGDRGMARFHELIDLGNLRRFLCEAEVASLYAMTGALLKQPGAFMELHFAYPQPPYASKYHDYFQCPVCFDAPSHMIVFNMKLLNSPIMMANPLAKQALISDCDMLLPLLKEHETITEKVLQELSIQKEGTPTLEELAKRINLSSRTLRRRLMEEETSYNAIVADIRKKRAIELLTTTRLSMEKVATRLGFSEVSSFYRAFKSWTGRRPNTFRE